MTIDKVDRHDIVSVCSCNAQAKSEYERIMNGVSHHHTVKVLFPSRVIYNDTYHIMFITMNSDHHRIKGLNIDQVVWAADEEIVARDFGELYMELYIRRTRSKKGVDEFNYLHWFREDV